MIDQRDKTLDTLDQKHVLQAVVSSDNRSCCHAGGKLGVLASVSVSAIGLETSPPRDVVHENLQSPPFRKFKGGRSQFREIPASFSDGRTCK